MRIFLMLLLSILFVSCDGVKELEEKMEKEYDLENENLEKRAFVLESDLKSKQKYFSAMEGAYEGSFVVGGKIFKTRVVLSSSIPPYESRRIRTAEEITTDLNNLYLTIQVTHWNSQRTIVASGCIITQAKHDFLKGQTLAADANCSNVYRISMYEPSLDSDDESEALNLTSQTTPQEIRETSQKVSQKILSGEIVEVEYLYLNIHPTFITNTFDSVLKRVRL